MNQNYFDAKCASLDRQIDSLVYDLYGLTTEEIQLVEAEQQQPLDLPKPKPAAKRKVSAKRKK